jgi:Radical SAM superfamily
MVKLVKLGAHKSIMFASGNRNFLEHAWIAGRSVKRTARYIMREAEIFACRVFMGVDVKVALKWSEHILSRYNNSLKAQNLWWRCRARVEGSETLEALNQDLSKRFCDRPFKWFEIATEESAFVCCPGWLPTSIGAAHDPMKTWHGPMAQKIRASILDGSYSYCSRVHCPAIAAKTLPLKTDVKPDPAYVLKPPPPKLVNLAYDRSCNIACPSCRVTIIVASKDEQAQMKAFYETSIAPIIATAEVVNVTGSGDPFGSPHFRWVLRQVTQVKDTKIDIQTNGVLFDQRAWKDLNLEGTIRRTLVSIDAARKETYDIVRRGGSFERVLKNVEFLVEQKREGKVSFVGLDFVVQALNYREILPFIELGKSLGVDKVRFNMIRDWNTFSGNEFEEQFIGNPLHPDHPEFEAILKSPMFGDMIIDPGNMWQFIKLDSKPVYVNLERDALHA